MWPEESGVLWKWPCIEIHCPPAINRSVLLRPATDWSGVVPLRSPVIAQVLHRLIAIRTRKMCSKSQLHILLEKLNVVRWMMMVDIAWWPTDRPIDRTLVPIESFSLALFKRNLSLCPSGASFLKQSVRCGHILCCGLRSWLCRRQLSQWSSRATGLYYYCCGNRWSIANPHFSPFL